MALSACFSHNTLPACVRHTDRRACGAGRDLAESRPDPEHRPVDVQARISHNWSDPNSSPAPLCAHPLGSTQSRAVHHTAIPPLLHMPSRHVARVVSCRRRRAVCCFAPRCASPAVFSDVLLPPELRCGTFCRVKHGRQPTIPGRLSGVTRLLFDCDTVVAVVLRIPAAATTTSIALAVLAGQ